MSVPLDARGLEITVLGHSINGKYILPEPLVSLHFSSSTQFLKMCEKSIYNEIRQKSQWMRISESSLTGGRDVNWFSHYEKPYLDFFLNWQ